MRIAIAGSSGLIGTTLVAALRERGDDAVPLFRPGSPASGGISWDPPRGRIDASALEGFDVVVNLAGRSIGERRWTDSEKRLLWDSRVDSTRLLASSIADLDNRPRLLVNASAVGYYGDRGDTELTETDAPGDGFFPDLVVAWEGATASASQAGIDVALLRSGIVLSPDGGALGRLLAPLGPTWFSPYRWGIAGPVGRGRQYWSWITLRDETRAILHVIDEGITGPVNLTAPEPVTHKAFVRALGRALRRPTVVPIPPFIVKLLIGRELAEATVLEGQRVLPAALLGTGFEFETTDVEAGLREALDR